MTRAGIGFFGPTLAAAGVLCLGIGAATAATSTTPGATLDANYPTHTSCRAGSGWIPEPGQWMAQTFTAVRSGELTDVLLPFLTSPRAQQPAAAKVTIVRTSGGNPLVSSVLATATAVAPVEPGVGKSANVEISFSSPAPVTAGAQYAIVVTQTATELTPDGYLAGGVGWYGDSAFSSDFGTCAVGTYAGGRMWTTNPDANVFNASGDFFFWTYVKPAATQRGDSAPAPAAKKAKPKAKKPPLCKQGQRSTKTHPCRKR